jgi:hypothetical protein
MSIPWLNLVGGCRRSCLDEVGKISPGSAKVVGTVEAPSVPGDGAGASSLAGAADLAVFVETAPGQTSDVADPIGSGRVAAASSSSPVEEKLTPLQLEDELGRCIAWDDQDAEDSVMIAERSLEVHNRAMVS